MIKGGYKVKFEKIYIESNQFYVSDGTFYNGLYYFVGKTQNISNSEPYQGLIMKKDTSQQCPGVTISSYLNNNFVNYWSNLVLIDLKDGNELHWQ